MSDISAIEFTEPGTRHVLVKSSQAQTVILRSPVTTITARLRAQCLHRIVFSGSAFTVTELNGYAAVSPSDIQLGTLDVAAYTSPCYQMTTRSAAASTNDLTIDIGNITQDWTMYLAHEPMDSAAYPDASITPRIVGSVNSTNLTNLASRPIGVNGVASFKFSASAPTAPLKSTFANVVRVSSNNSYWHGSSSSLDINLNKVIAQTATNVVYNDDLTYSPWIRLTSSYFTSLDNSSKIATIVATSNPYLSLPGVSSYDFFVCSDSAGLMLMVTGETGNGAASMVQGVWYRVTLQSSSVPVVRRIGRFVDAVETLFVGPKPLLDVPRVTSLTSVNLFMPNANANLAIVPNTTVRLQPSNTVLASVFASEAKYVGTAGVFPATPLSVSAADRLTPDTTKHVLFQDIEGRYYYDEDLDARDLRYEVTHAANKTSLKVLNRYRPGKIPRLTSMNPITGQISAAFVDNPNWSNDIDTSLKKITSLPVRGDFVLSADRGNFVPNPEEYYGDDSEAWSATVLAQLNQLYDNGTWSAPRSATGIVMDNFNDDFDNTIGPTAGGIVLIGIVHADGTDYALRIGRYNGGVGLPVQVLKNNDKLYEANYVIDGQTNLRISKTGNVLEFKLGSTSLLTTLDNDLGPVQAYVATNMIVQMNNIELSGLTDAVNATTVNWTNSTSTALTTSLVSTAVNNTAVLTSTVPVYDITAVPTSTTLLVDAAVRFMVIKTNSLVSTVHTLAAIEGANREIVLLDRNANSKYVAWTGTSLTIAYDAQTSTFQAT